ncbi:MAG: DUF2062 domain-containing protein [Opitutales bacterium]
MMEEEEALQALRRSRVVRVKRMLRWMPRRANMHRYPVLKWFGVPARQRAELWSFRTRNAVPAIYAGLLLALTPLYGVQLPLSVLLAFWLRANLPILCGIQFITNPLTVFPIYFSAFHIGRITLQLVGLEVPNLNMAQFKLLLNSLMSFELRHSFGFIWQTFASTTLGGWMMGLFSATIAATIYRVGAYEVGQTYQRLHELQRRREAARAAEEAAPGAEPGGHIPHRNGSSAS